MQRTTTVTSRRPAGWVHASDLGWGSEPKLHGMQGVKARIGLAVPDLPRALRALGNDAVVAEDGLTDQVWPSNLLPTLINALVSTRGVTRQRRTRPMPTEKDPTQELQAQVLDGIRKSQEAVIDGMRTWAETIQQLVPSTAQAAVPRTGQLPTPTEVVDSVFDFAAQLLDAQRQLAHSVLGATTAVSGRIQEETEKATSPARKSTKR
jgi:hypothetical protein